MTGELVVYGASLVGLLFLLFFLPVLLLLTLVQRRRGRRPEGAAQEEWRRCNRCRRRWYGVQGSDVSRRELRRRRDARRAAREAGTARPDWTAAQGWGRCPSCLSRDVRTSTGSGGGGARRG